MNVAAGERIRAGPTVVRITKHASKVSRKPDLLCSRTCSIDGYSELRRDMVAVTAAVSAMSCILFGLMTNMPVAVA